MAVKRGVCYLYANHTHIITPLDCFEKAASQQTRNSNYHNICNNEVLFFDLKHNIQNISQKNLVHLECYWCTKSEKRLLRNF